MRVSLCVASSPTHTALGSGAVWPASAQQPRQDFGDVVASLCQTVIQLLQQQQMQWQQQQPWKVITAVLGMYSELAEVLKAAEAQEAQ